MAVTIPSSSVVTNAMVTDWMSHYGRSSDNATLDLLDIEEGRRELPDELPQSTYAALITRYQGVTERMTQGQIANRRSLAAVTLGGLALASAIFGQVFLGGDTVNNTALTCYRHITSTINPDLLNAQAATSSFISVNADANDSIRIGSMPPAWGQLATSSNVMVWMSASGTAQVMFQNYASSSASTVNFPSADVGLDILCHS